VNNDGLHSMTVHKIGKKRAILHPEKKSSGMTFHIPAIFSTAQNMGSEFYCRSSISTYCRSSISTSNQLCIWAVMRYVLGHNVSFHIDIADEVLVDDEAVRPFIYAGKKVCSTPCRSYSAVKLKRGPAAWESWKALFKLCPLVLTISSTKLTRRKK